MFYQRFLDRGWDCSTSLLIPYICNLPYRLPGHAATKSKLYLPCCTGIRNMCFDGHKGIKEDIYRDINGLVKKSQSKYSDNCFNKSYICRVYLYINCLWSYSFSSPSES